MSPTATELRRTERVYRGSVKSRDEAFDKRNIAVHAALVEGWSQAAIAEEMGLSRGRVGQIAMMIRRVRFLADDPEGRWKAGAMADDLGRESSGVPTWVFQLDDGPRITLTNPHSSGLVELVGVRAA